VTDLLLDAEASWETGSIDVCEFSAGRDRGGRGAARRRRLIPSPPAGRSWRSPPHDAEDRVGSHLHDSYLQKLPPRKCRLELLDATGKEEAFAYT
jgi:hypothetical protein